MKALFITAKTSPDYLASVLWDGMQRVLGESNVYDGVECSWLHNYGTPGDGALRYIGQTMKGMSLREEADFDLIVLVSSFNRDFNWKFARDLVSSRLKAGGKVAYVEGWDAAWQIEMPEIHVDAVFRKEISLFVSYPYVPHHLSFAVPPNWFIDQQYLPGREIDCFVYCKPSTCDPIYPNMRWDCLSKIFQTKTKHNSVVSTKDLGYEDYIRMLCKSKLAICPAAADGADSMRTYEAVSCGAIPVFVNHPPHIRDPWFPVCFDCTVDTLPQHIDEALSQPDMEEKRLAMYHHAKKHHTTTARAEKVLEVLFG